MNVKDPWIQKKDNNDFYLKGQLREKKYQNSIFYILNFYLI